MDRVIAAQVYLRICELGSLSAAARALGMSRRAGCASMDR